MDPCPNDSEALWTAEDVARFLRCSRSMVYKLRRVGALPSTPVGALHRFIPERVRAYARGEVVAVVGRRVGH